MSGCCSGLEAAIESKTRHDFSDQIKSNLESFRLQFTQRESRIRHHLKSIFNETADRVNQKYSVRMALANAELVSFVNQHVFYKPSFHSAEMHSHVDNLLKAIVISELERSHVSEYAHMVSCCNYI